MIAVVDPGSKQAEELSYLHFVFEQADEAYREFRKAILEHNDESEVIRVREWIPISKH